MGTLHLTVNVLVFFLEYSAPLEAKDDYLLLSWSDSKWAHLVHCEEIFDSELELLTPLWQAVFGSYCSVVVLAARNCSATHHGGRTTGLTARLCSHLLGQAQDGVAQRVQGVRGLAVGGTTPDTHGRPHGLLPQGWPSPQDEALQGTALLGASRKTPGRYPEDTMRSVRIV